MGRALSRAARAHLLTLDETTLLAMPLVTHATPATSLRSPAVVHGTGLFTARDATITIRPAPAGHGLVFRRIDLPQSPPIPALATNGTNDPRLPGRNTTLIADPRRPASATNATIATVEHVLSALAGLGVTEAIVEIDGPEVPIGDGSALPFVEAIDRAGLVELPGSAVRAIELDRRIEVPDARTPGGPVVLLEPAADLGPQSGLWLSYELDYGPDSGIAPSTVAFSISPAIYRSEIAPARTFCLDHEARTLQAAGYFPHVTPRDLLVLDTKGQPIENEFRFADEPARHKLLDLLGDLTLAGRPLRGRVTARRSGHALNRAAALAARAMADQ